MSQMTSSNDQQFPRGDGCGRLPRLQDGASKPYCDSKGVYWVKNGPDKRRVQSPEELARLFQSGEQLYAEGQVVAASTLEDFDHDRFGRWRWRHERAVRTFLPLCTPNQPFS